MATKACKRIIVCSSTELGCFKDCILSRVTLEDYTRRILAKRAAVGEEAELYMRLPRANMTFMNGFTCIITTNSTVSDLDVCCYDNYVLGHAAYICTNHWLRSVNLLCDVDARADLDLHLHKCAPHEIPAGNDTWKLFGPLLDMRIYNLAICEDYRADGRMQQ